MDKKIIFGRSTRDILLALSPFALLLLALFIAYKVINPTPPNRLVITTSTDEGDYQTYAKLYQNLLKEDGVTLELRPSSGSLENLNRLKDPNSGVEVGFVQDGLGTAEEAPELSSLGSLYYEPIWIFYRSKSEMNRISQLRGKKVAIGRENGGTMNLSLHLLKPSGVDGTNSTLIHKGWAEAADLLQKGQIDAAFFLATPEDPLIDKLVADPTLRLMSLDQAEAIVRQIPFLHHLVLPHGALNLKENIPARDIDLVAPTATLLVKDSMHPALMYLLLKAASQVHGEPGIFEKKNEFPVDKDYEFPLTDEAKHYYKSGTPFWQRYLPFWLATLVDRFVIVMLPLIILILPAMRSIPKFLAWRVKARIYRQYGELKFLETQISTDAQHTDYEKFLEKLDHIEEQVNAMKVPIDFSDFIYGLREHIDFVRARLGRIAAKTAPLSKS